MALPEVPEPSTGIFATFDEDGRPTGFYSEISHGPRMIPEGRLVGEDPNDLWVRPTVVYDMVPNPDCKIPPEAVPISREEHARWTGVGE